MKHLILALQFMTRLPLPAIAADRADFARAMRWFPAAGLVVGGCVAGAVWTLGRVDPWLGALGGLAAWVGMTGALHLDGLGDMADAAGAGHKDPARIKAVLSDPHIGSFGVVAIVMQLLAKLVLLHDVGDALWLVPIAVAARVGPLVWTLVLPPLHEGLGTLFRDGVGWGHVAVWGGVLAVALPSAPWLMVTVPAIGLWALWIARRIGGISGDGHGAGIELVETALLLAIVCAR